MKRTTRIPRDIEHLLRRLPFMLLLAPLFVVESTTAHATGNFSNGHDLQVGVSKIDITPQWPVHLISRTHDAEEAAGKLWARAIAFGDDRQEPSVLITIDAIGITRDVTERVAERLQETVSLARSNLAICATHTHTAPNLVGLLPYHLGRPLPADSQERLAQYTVWLTARLVEAAQQALADRQPARVEWGQGTASFAHNRRHVVNGQWQGFGVHEKGPVDHDMPLLVARGADGSVRAVLLSYASHATTLKVSFNQIHGDWPGAAARMIEENHPGAVALIAIGAGADADPGMHGGHRGTLQDVREYGREIATEADRLLGTDLKVLSNAPRTRWKRIELPFSDVPSREEWELLAGEDGRLGYYARETLAQLERGGKVPHSLPYAIQVWAFGDDLAMVFLAGEVVVDYSLRLKQELDAARLWINAYANEQPSYIASARLIREGGYEVSGSMPSYGQPSPLSPQVEDLIVQMVHELIPAAFDVHSPAPPTWGK